jgi:hypothetical protein
MSDTASAPRFGITFLGQREGSVRLSKLEVFGDEAGQVN